MEEINGKIKCLICGLEFKRVCAHVRQVHGMSAREYKEEFGLDVKKGLLTDEGREIMRRHAYANGMHERMKELGKAHWFKKGDTKAGRYKRSEQTLERLKQNRFKVTAKKGPRYKITCIVCGTEFEVTHSRKDEAKFCNRSCRTSYCNKLRAKK